MRAKTTERVLQFAACLMIELILFMPFYISDVYAQDEPDTTPPFINLTIPQIYNKDRIHIEGTTEPFSNLKLYINSIYERQIGSAGTSNGRFLFRDVQLNNMQTNTISIAAEDMAGNFNERTSVVYVDATPPIVNISKIPAFSTEDSLLIKGTVDEQVHIDFYVKSEKEKSAKQPSAVQSVHIDPKSLDPNSVTIAWVDNPAEEEVTDYLIYRSDVGLIATISSSSFTDILVSTNKSYAYKVSAMNKYCIEGPKTEVKITTPLGGMERDVIPPKIEVKCEKEGPQHSIDTGAGTFEQRIDLFSGRNSIMINVSDIANNSVSFSASTYVDTEPPEISGVNFNDISPSYIRDVAITGKVSENATVHIYVNNKADPQKSVRTAEDGSFSVDIRLERTISLETYERTGAQVVTGEAGREWINYINITAVDDSGQASSITGEVQYALCGEGADWDIDVSDVTPDTLLPRFIMEGIGQIGFDAKIRWQGPGDEQGVSVSNIVLEKMPLSPQQKDKYDLDWVGSMPVPVKSSDSRNSYFLIKLKVPGAVAGNTTLEQEDNISNHRVGECAIPGMGCIKIPVIMRIDYNYYDPYNRSDVARTQKHCMDIKVMIDRRVPPDKIPTAFLITTIDALNSTINLIDHVLKPVKTARKWVFLACAGSWVLWWMKRAGEWMHCIGARPETCNPEGETEEEGDDYKCAECLKSKSETIAFWVKSQWLCDRIMCPPAPTIQKYIEDARDGKIARSHCSNQDISDIEYNKITTDKAGFDEFMNPGNMSLYVRTADKVKKNELAGYPDPDKCEFEYYMNYNSVALFVNELEESYCVTNPTKDQMEENKYASGIDCGGVGKVLRVIGGICSKQESQNMTLSVVEKGKTKYYYIEQKEINKRIAKEAIKKRQIIDEVVDGKVIKRDVTIYEPQDEIILDSNMCVSKETGKIIDYKDYSRSKGEKALPEQVWNAVCQPPREYVVDPTSGLITSFRSVCLTAIAEYLQHWRTILSMVKNCLQTILYTGDGSAGICKQVLTIYLCDLIYYAIQCIKEKAATAYGDEKVLSGAGGFLSYMQDSSAQMQQGIRGRYGSSAVYQTLFVEKKLIHSVCAFAFTGDWNLDLDAFLEEEITVPIETSCFATGTRRFLTKDPAQQGQANFMYHLGVFIVSGAKDLRYDVELVCSGDNTCGADIDEHGVCDCMKNEKGDTPHPGISVGPGHLGQGEVVDEEVFLPVTKPFRYDKIRILVSYTDANNNRIENKLCGESSIIEVGGSPPADCSFDLSDLVFRCAFEWGEHGSAKFKDIIRFDGDKTEFFNGDKLYIGGEIEKFEKSSEVNERMALWYKIYRKGQSNTFYKTAYIPFSQSNPKIMDLFTSPLQISSSAVNQVKSDKSFEFNPFVDITQQTSLKIDGAVDPIHVDITPEMVMDDVIDLQPIEINIEKGGTSIDSGICRPISKKEFTGGFFKCEITGIKNRYTVTIKMREGKEPKDIKNPMTIRIFPPKTQTGSVSEIVNMVLELSLHYIDPETDRVNPSPIDFEGTRQVKLLEFRASSSKALVARREGACANYEGRNPNTNPCYCDPVAADYDCGTDEKKKYCYQDNANKWMCVEYPKCGPGENTEKCDCDLDGVYNDAIDCNGATMRYCYLGKCSENPQNFPPELQEVKYYKDNKRVEEYTGKLPKGRLVYVVLKLYDNEGIKSASYGPAPLTEITEISSKEVSFWGGFYTILEVDTNVTITAVDKEGERMEQEREVSVGEAGIAPSPATIKGIPTSPPAGTTPYTVQQIQKMAVEKAESYNIDPVLFLSILMQESSFLWWKKGPDVEVDRIIQNALGVAQLMPATARDLGVANPFDAKQAIDGSVRYLDKISNNFPQNSYVSQTNGITYLREDIILMTYYAGIENMNKFLAGEKSKVGPDTRAYPNQVKRHKGDMIIIAQKYSSTPQAITV